MLIRALRFKIRRRIQQGSSGAAVTKTKVSHEGNPRGLRSGAPLNHHDCKFIFLSCFLSKFPVSTHFDVFFPEIQYLLIPANRRMPVPKAGLRPIFTNVPIAHCIQQRDHSNPGFHGSNKTQIHILYINRNKIKTPSFSHHPTKHHQQSHPAHSQSPSRTTHVAPRTASSHSR